MHNLTVGTEAEGRMEDVAIDPVSCFPSVRADSD